MRMCAQAINPLSVKRGHYADEPDFLESNVALIQDLSGHSVSPAGLDGNASSSCEQHLPDATTRYI